LETSSLVSFLPLRIAIEQQVVEEVREFRFIVDLFEEHDVGVDYEMMGYDRFRTKWSSLDVPVHGMAKPQALTLPAVAFRSANSSCLLSAHHSCGNCVNAFGG
jgi:hypothetical protein